MASKGSDGKCLDYAVVLVFLFVCILVFIVGVLLACMSLPCVYPVPSEARRGYLLEMELQIIVSYHVGARN